MTFTEYLESIKGKRVAVIGIGISNTPLIQILLSAGSDVTACDQKNRAELGQAADDLISKGARLCLGKQYLEGVKGAQIIFRTPGLHPQIPELVQAVKNGAELTSEMEVFFKVCPCRTIAITGSDGKTTTTTLIAEFLKAKGTRPFIGGNIGAPLLPEVMNMKSSDIAVLELSSFQLMTMNSSPDIAVITNLAPNHLDMHKSFEEYVEAKENIYLHQKKSDLLVLNRDDMRTDAFSAKAKGQVLKFGSQNRPEDGIYCENGVIYRVKGEKSEQVLKTVDIKIPGWHNVENYMAAIAATDGMVGYDSIRKVAKSFNGVEHRIEFVRTFKGADYYNDSIASSPSRTIAGLKAFDGKIILIAGGYDKNIPYDELGKYIVRHVKTLVLTGATAQKIKAAVLAAGGGDLRILEKESFTEAILSAAREAEPGDKVLFSPASASFDQFKNFMERGRAFKKIIIELSD